MNIVNCPHCKASQPGLSLVSGQIVTADGVFVRSYDCVECKRTVHHGWRGKESMPNITKQEFINLWNDTQSAFKITDVIYVHFSGEAAYVQFMVDSRYPSTAKGNIVNIPTMTDEVGSWNALAKKIRSGWILSLKDDHYWRDRKS